MVDGSLCEYVNVMTNTLMTEVSGNVMPDVQVALGRTLNLISWTYLLVNYLLH
jgi:hypothetical protein